MYALHIHFTNEIFFSIVILQRVASCMRATKCSHKQYGEAVWFMFCPLSIGDVEAPGFIMAMAFFVFL